MRSVHGRVELLDRGQVPGGLVGRHDHRHAARERDRLRVGGPVRGGQQRLVAVVEQRGERLVHGLLAAVGDEHLVGRHLVAGVAGGLDGDGRPQLGQAGGRRVLVHLRVGGRALRRLDDVVRSREVGLAGAEPDDRPAGRLQRLGFRVYGQGRGFGDGGHAGRYSRGWHASMVSPPARRPPTGFAVATCQRASGAAEFPTHLVRRGGAFGIHSGGCNRRAVAQLVESRSPKPAVGGSSPSCPASADWLDRRGPGRTVRGGSV